jgi:hypothetical protein
MTTLSDYITQTRRLLHDANANFWTDVELTDDINSARNRLVRDTGINRVLQPYASVTNQEVYQFSDLPQGLQTMDVVNVNLYWGNTRIPLRYLPWTQFNAELRFWQNYVGRPIAFSMYGPNSYYLAPVPDQVYTMELDTVVEPTPLVNQADIETQIVAPYNDPVSFYAAHLAKFKEQSYGEAELFKKQYDSKVQNLQMTTFTRRMPDPYSRPY